MTIVMAGLVLAACTSTTTPSPTVTVTESGPTKTVAETPTPTPTPALTSTPTPAPTETAASSYDLDAVFTACVDAQAETARLPGIPIGYDPAAIEPASTNFYLKDRFADDPAALAFYFEFDPETEDLADTVPVLCSVSGPFDDPIVTYERSLT
jgi:hypothetical protein